MEAERERERERETWDRETLRDREREREIHPITAMLQGAHYNMNLFRFCTWKERGSGGGL